MKHYLHSIDPQTNRYRWYAMHLQFCLGGGVDLIRRWGRLGEGEGREKVDHFKTEAEALQAIEQLLGRRYDHGYEDVFLPGNPPQAAVEPAQMVFLWASA